MKKKERKEKEKEAVNLSLVSLLYRPMIVSFYYKRSYRPSIDTRDISNPILLPSRAC